MCLAVLAIDVHPDWPLIVIANRDEFHLRPTAIMQPWVQTPTLLAGQDLLARGTWLGVTTTGKFALLTNVRDPANHRHEAPTRGALVERYLNTAVTASGYLDELASEASSYNGFNLIVGEAGTPLWHASNAQKPFYAKIAPGIHGISNALLDTPWIKTVRSTQAVHRQLKTTPQALTPDIDALVTIMLDTTPVPDDQLPSTGIGLARERLLASPFIISDDYGTRCTTLLLRHRHGQQWVQEDTYDPHGQRTGRVRYVSEPRGDWRRTEAGPGSLNTD